MQDDNGGYGKVLKRMTLFMNSTLLTNTMLSTYNDLVPTVCKVRSAGVQYMLEIITIQHSLLLTGLHYLKVKPGGKYQNYSNCRDQNIFQEPELAQDFIGRKTFLFCLKKFTMNG